MWEEDGLNFLDKMLSTSRLIKICLQKYADDEDDAYKLADDEVISPLQQASP